jgi:DNA-binding transcriptional regulator YhcF (GntR family)
MTTPRSIPYDPTPPVRRGRPPVKASAIAARLKQQLVDGSLRPGARLPPQRRLMQRYRVSLPTVQQAMSPLVRDGFLVTRGARGTFVAAHPPHLCRYGIVFPYRPRDHENWNEFWRTLYREALALDGVGERRLPVYYDVRAHESSRDYRQLVHDIRAGLLAGLLFTYCPHELLGTAVLRHRGLPRVALSPVTGTGLPVVRLDQASFIRKALARVCARGRQRVALLLPAAGPEWVGPWTAGMAECGLRPRPGWLLSVPPPEPAGATAITRLLFQPAARGEWPDALIVADDNLLPHVIAGIQAAGVEVPGQVEVVAHANFPLARPCPLPVCRLGYSARQILLESLAMLDSQRRRESCPDRVVPAWFAEELSAAPSGKG